MAAHGTTLPRSWPTLAAKHTACSQPRGGSVMGTTQRACLASTGKTAMMHSTPHDSSHASPWSCRREQLQLQCKARLTGVDMISVLSPVNEFQSSSTVYCCHETCGRPVAPTAVQAREVVAGLGTAAEQLAALLMLWAEEGKALQVLTHQRLPLLDSSEGGNSVFDSYWVDRRATGAVQQGGHHCIRCGLRRSSWGHLETTVSHWR